MIKSGISILAFIIASIPAYCQITGGIKGKLFDKATKQTIAGASIVLKEIKKGTMADTTGAFTLENIPEGNYSMVISLIGYQEKTINDVRVIRDKINYIEVEIETAIGSLQEVTVKARKSENNRLMPVSAYSFSREEIARNPGAQGDIFRAIGMLPGVSSSGGQYSAIAVRGQGTRDNVYMVDDIPITEVGHLEGGSGGFNDPNGGRFSIFAPRVIDNAQFQGGGFAAQYGRRSASYLGLGIKEGNKLSHIIDGQIDLLGFTLNYDGPSYIQKNTSLFVSARYQDFSALVSVINLKDIGIPKYADFIFKSTTQLNSKNKLSVIAIYSPESYKRNIENVRADEKLNNLDISNSSTNKTIFGLNLRTLTSKTNYWKNILYFTNKISENTGGTAHPQTDAFGRLINPDNIPFETDVTNIKYSEAKIGYRSIYTMNFKNNSQLVAGIDLDRVSLSNNRKLNRLDTAYVFDSKDIRPDPSQYYSIKDPVYFNAGFNNAAYNISAYIDYSFLLFKSLTINVGTRYDYTGFCQQHTFSPRLSGSYLLGEGSTINFATGIYYQDPVYSDIADQPITQKLKTEKTTQVILGFKKYFAPDLKLTIEGWYKSFDKMIVRPISSSSEQNNNGTGWAGGIDINLTKRLTKNIHGQIGYSFMQSKRNDNDGLGEYNFLFSQPHQVNFLISYQAGKRWNFASKFRYATGKPTSSYIIHNNIFNNPTYIRSSEEIIGKNDTRLRDFISWDIRADYRFQLKKLGLAIFVDIVNILSRGNQNEQRFNSITGKIYYDGLAIFPSFGLKIEF